MLGVAATNLMAIAIANKDQKQAVDILSDAVGIALVCGVLFGAATYFACPSILEAMTGSSADVLAPAISYVQIRPASFVPPPHRSRLLCPSPYSEHACRC